MPQDQCVHRQHRHPHAGRPHQDGKQDGRNRCPVRICRLRADLPHCQNSSRDPVDRDDAVAALDTLRIKRAKRLWGLNREISKLRACWQLKPGQIKGRAAGQNVAVFVKGDQLFQTQICQIVIGVRQATVGN